MPATSVLGETGIGASGHITECPVNWLVPCTVNRFCLKKKKKRRRMIKKGIPTLTFGLYGQRVAECTCIHYIYMQMSVTHTHLHALYTHADKCVHSHNFRKVLVEMQSWSPFVFFPLILRIVFSYNIS